MLIGSDGLALGKKPKEKEPEKLAKPKEEVQRRQISQAYGNLPLYFIPNEGQIDPKVKFYTQGPGYTFYFTPEEGVFSFVKKVPSERSVPSTDLRTLQMQIQEQAKTKTLVLTLKFLGSNPKTRIEGRSKGTGKVSYFIGKDQSKWQSGLPTYHEVAYKELWSHVDLVFRGSGGKLKYEFVLQPGAKVKNVRLAYGGAEGITLDKEGNLLIKTADGMMTDEAPSSYQMIEGEKVLVDVQYMLLSQTNSPNAYGFKVVDQYNSGYPLIIDPSIPIPYLGKQNEKWN